MAYSLSQILRSTWMSKFKAASPETDLGIYLDTINSTTETSKKHLDERKRCELGWGVECALLT